MAAKMVSETLGFFLQLTLLVAGEEFIEYSRHERFKSYNIQVLSLLGFYLKYMSHLHTDKYCVFYRLIP